MDQTSLVVPELEAAERFLRYLQSSGFPVTAAAWIKEPEMRDWYLFLASPKVEELGLREAYSIVGDSLRQFPPSPWFDRFRVRLIGSTNPIAADIVAFQMKYPSPAMTPIRFYGPRLGDLSVDGAYLFLLQPNPAIVSS